MEPRPSSRAAIAAVALLALLLVAPTGAHAASRCDGPVAQTFLPWQDLAWYTPAPDSGFEAGSGSWALEGGARRVDGNEPYFVGDAGDRRALALPVGGAATTGDICIDVEHPSLRFFARNSGSALSRLAVTVSFRDALGQPQSLPIGAVAGQEEWAPAPPLPVAVNLLSLLGDQRVTFQIAPADSLGDWRIDDVYVDPYSKG